MQLTAYTDYALRVLIYLAVHEAHVVTISEMATAYDISKNHLVKIVHQLGQEGFIETLRGRGGGLRLAHAPDQIYLGEIVRKWNRIFMSWHASSPRRTAVPLPQSVVWPAC